MTADPTRAAMQAALDALDDALGVFVAEGHDHVYSATHDEMTAARQRLRAALAADALVELAQVDRELGLDYAAPEPQPIAWGVRDEVADPGEPVWVAIFDYAQAAHDHINEFLADEQLACAAKHWRVRPLYAGPQGDGR